MKRSALLLASLALATAGTANAQLTMQMSNGWSFSFSGNVNAFLDYEKVSTDGQVSNGANLVPDGANAFKQTRIQTGLLPAFAVFDAKGKEGNTDLGVHFGFAPQINCASGVHDCFGAQIDMRQVFLTVGGSWGQILAGRELGLFGRQNILNDQTLFGVGGTGAGGPGTGAGTTLGRIGYGYNYPQFKAQMTYSTAAGKPGQLSIGLFEAASNGPYFTTEIPRLEFEGTYKKGKAMGWIGGLAQTNKNGYTGTTNSASSYGVSGGLKFGQKDFSLVGSGYYGKGIGTTLLFNIGTGSAIAGNGSDDLTTSYGYIGQATYTSNKITIAGSYGSSILEDSKNGEAAAGAKVKNENTLISGGLYYQATKSLKAVFEGNYAWSKQKNTPGGDPKKNTTFVPAFGLMLFF
jgi:Gram-negative porin